MFKNNKTWKRTIAKNARILLLFSLLFALAVTTSACNTKHLENNDSKNKDVGSTQSDKDEKYEKGQDGEKETGDDKDDKDEKAENKSEITISLDKDNQLYQGFHGMKLGNTRKLVPAELEKINLCFETLIPDTVQNPNADYKVNPLSHFFTSFYEDPKQISFDDFILYFESESLKADKPEDVKQFEALKQIAEFPFTKTKDISELLVPIHRKTGKSLNHVLELYAGIQVKDLQKPYKIIYLEEYDSFYTYESDFGAGIFRCESGIIDGNKIKLSDDNAILTLKYEDGKLLIESFQPLKK